MSTNFITSGLACAALLVPLLGSAQTPTAKPIQGDAGARDLVPAATLPGDYVIGVEDVLSVVFWREKEMSADVVVRPDGKISLPMLNDVHAAGLTPEALAAVVATAGTKFVRDAGATVIVKEIRSRKVYIIGEVARPGTFQLASAMNVLQALGEAGGFIEGADKGDVIIVRNEGGKERRFKFNYNDVVKGKNPAQNIRLLPGDTIIVR
ncbi:MAG: polysaccharide biosynthesis/export family protein, partial [Candidatus Hydrogenedentales bacterium]